MLREELEAEGMQWAAEAALEAIPDDLSAVYVTLTEGMNDDPYDPRKAIILGLANGTLCHAELAYTDLGSGNSPTSATVHRIPLRSLRMASLTFNYDTWKDQAGSGGAARQPKLKLYLAQEIDGLGSMIELPVDTKRDYERKPERIAEKVRAFASAIANQDIT